jgi:hypothetical protein
MHRQHQSRPLLPCFKGLLVCTVLAISCFSTPQSLFAADDATDIPRTDPAADMFMPVRESVANIKNLFSGIKQYLGIPYRFGGDSPSGFDCSGFVRYMFNKELDVKLPRSSQEMSAMGTRVERNELRPGDLVLFKNGKNRINHVGIFVGNGAFVHSSLSKGITRDTLNESYYSKHFATGVRILDVQENQLPQDFDLTPNVTDENGSAS